MIRQQFVDRAVKLFEKNGGAEETLLSLAAAQEEGASVGELHCMLLAPVVHGRFPEVSKFVSEHKTDPRFDKLLTFFRQVLLPTKAVDPNKKLDREAIQAELAEGSKAFVEALGAKLDDNQKSMALTSPT